MENGVQMIKILWSIHNSAWLLIWMDMLFDRRKYIDSDKKFIVTIFLSGMLWYGLQKYLSWIPLLLLLTILGYLLWNGSVEKVASLRQPPGMGVGAAGRMDDNKWYIDIGYKT